MLALTPEEPPDPVDGDTNSPVRELALQLMARHTDDLSDAEHLLRQTDRYWWLNYCLERWHTTPDRVDRWLLCREHTWLQAHAIVSDAYRRLTTRYRHYFKEPS